MPLADAFIQSDLKYTFSSDSSELKPHQISATADTIFQSFKMQFSRLSPMETLPVEIPQPQHATAPVLDRKCKTSQK